MEVSIYFSVSFEVTYKLREKGKSKKVTFRPSNGGNLTVVETTTPTH